MKSSFKACEEMNPRARKNVQAICLDDANNSFAYEDEGLLSVRRRYASQEIVSARFHTKSFRICYVFKVDSVFYLVVPLDFFRTSL